VLAVILLDAPEYGLRENGMDVLAVQVVAELHANLRGQRLYANDDPLDRPAHRLELVYGGTKSVPKEIGVGICESCRVLGERLEAEADLPAYFGIVHVSLARNIAGHSRGAQATA
jgi:hypothetical protein